MDINKLKVWQAVYGGGIHCIDGYKHDPMIQFPGEKPIKCRRCSALLQEAVRIY